MKIEISEQVYTEIIRHASETFPYECCGLLLGFGGGSFLAVTECVPVPNTASEPAHRYVMDPAVLIPYLYNDTSRRIVGIFHSHPHSPAYPSGEDLEYAWLSVASHWIVSLAESSVPVLKCFRYEYSGGSKQKKILPLHFTVKQKYAIQGDLDARINLRA